MGLLLKMMMIEMICSATTITLPCMMLDTILVQEVEKLEMPGQQLECMSGCSLMPVASIICHRVQEWEEEEVVSTIYLSNILLHCNTSPPLPQPLELHLLDLNCQYCDHTKMLLVQNSCSLRFSLSLVDTAI